MADEISISSTPRDKNQTISVHLSQKNDRTTIKILSKCSIPYYVVRLSGPGLIGMKQMHHFHLNHSMVRRLTYMRNQIQFPYYREDTQGTLTEIQMQPVPVEGTYHLEILQLACRHNGTTVQDNCIPRSTETLVLNEPTVAKLYREEARCNECKGHWLFNGGVESSSEPPKVETRFQLDKDCSESNCTLDWFDHYSYVDENIPINLDKLQNHSFCFLGDSHSKRMFRSIRKFALDSNSSNINANIIYMTFPQHWTMDTSRFMTRIQRENCTHIIMAVGQWPLSKWNKLDRPMDPDAWIHHIHAIVDYLHVHSNVSIILRSIHYVPLGYIRMSCPPADWRMPYMVDVYNEKLRMLCESHPVFQNNPNNKFIDTNPVLGAVWDTAEDFNHLQDKVGLAEIQYLLHRIVEEEDTNTRHHALMSSQTTKHSYALSDQGNEQCPFRLFPNKKPFLLQHVVASTVMSLSYLLMKYPVLRRCKRRRNT